MTDRQILTGTGAISTLTDDDLDRIERDLSPGTLRALVAEVRALRRERDAAYAAIRTHRDTCLSEDAPEVLEVDGEPVFAHTLALWSVLPDEETTDG